MNVATVGTGELVIFHLADLVPLEAKSAIARLPQILTNLLSFTIVDSPPAHIGYVLITERNGIVGEWYLRAATLLDAFHGTL